MSFDNFLGKWVISESHYEMGTPPQSGSYTISIEKDTTLRFDMEWIDSQGQSHSMYYLSNVDGEMHKYENKSVADYVKSTLVNPRRMLTSSFKDDKETSVASRDVSEDGQEMIVLQSGFLPTGEKFTNKSIYVKVNI